MKYLLSLILLIGVMQAQHVDESVWSNDPVVVVSTDSIRIPETLHPDSASFFETFEHDLKYQEPVIKAEHSTIPSLEFVFEYWWIGAIIFIGLIITVAILSS